MQRAALEKVLEKTGMQEKEIRFLFGGDLLGQLIATSFGVKELKSRCLVFTEPVPPAGEALCLAAMTVAGVLQTMAKLSPAVILAEQRSSFVFPEYGNQRPLSAT